MNSKYNDIEKQCQFCLSDPGTSVGNLCCCTHIYHENDGGCRDGDPDDLVPGGEEGFSLLCHRVDPRRLHRRLVLGPSLLAVLEVAVRGCDGEGATVMTLTVAAMIP